MTNMPLVSVIVPVYNVEKYLTRCIDSIIGQTYRNLEIVLVDDGSPDNSPAICDEYAQKDSRITVIHKENGGLSSARNSGLDTLHGEYVMFVDSDDFIHPECIQKLFKIAVDSKCEIVQCSFEKGINECFSCKNHVPTIIYCDYEAALSGFVYKTIAWGKLYHKSVIKQVSFPVGRINEDEATYYQFAYFANRIAITDEKLYYYFQAENSITRNERCIQKTDFIDILEERIAFFEEKNEQKLVRSSIERYLVILMLYYADWCCNKNIKNNPQILWQKFKENYKRLKTFRGTPMKLKLMFWLFYHFPGISSRAIYILRKQG